MSSLQIQYIGSFTKTKQNKTKQNKTKDGFHFQVTENSDPLLIISFKFFNVAT